MVQRSNWKQAPLQLVTGKGGVGKTSVVTARAIAAARMGCKPLIVEMGERASLEGMLGCGPVNYSPREVWRSGGASVWATRLEFEPCVRDAVESVVPVKTLVRRVLANEALRAFLHAAPGIAEVASLLRLRRLVEQGSYAPILVDLDATGHALMFLELPSVFASLGTRGAVTDALHRVTAILSDAQMTALDVVALPADLVLQETANLYASLRRDNRVALGRLWINQMPMPLEEELRVFAHEAMHESELDAEDVSVVQEWIARAERERERAERVRASLQSVAAVPSSVLPRVMRSEQVLETLATCVMESL